MKDVHSEIGPVTEEMVRRLNAGEMEAFNDIYHATPIWTIRTWSGADAR